MKVMEIVFIAKITKVKPTEPKYIQTDFSFDEHTNFSRSPEIKYIPPKPSEMTDAELEKFYISRPNERAKREIMKRIDNGSKFRHFRLEKYKRASDKLVIVFDDTKVNL